MWVPVFSRIFFVYHLCLFLATTGWIGVETADRLLVLTINKQIQNTFFFYKCAYILVALTQFFYRWQTAQPDQVRRTTVCAGGAQAQNYLLISIHSSADLRSSGGYTNVPIALGPSISFHPGFVTPCTPLVPKQSTSRLL